MLPGRVPKGQLRSLLDGVICCRPHLPLVSSAAGVRTRQLPLICCCIEGCSGVLATLVASQLLGILGSLLGSQPVSQAGTSTGLLLGVALPLLALFSQPPFLCTLGLTPGAEAAAQPACHALRAGGSRRAPSPQRPLARPWRLLEAAGHPGRRHAAAATMAVPWAVAVFCRAVGPCQLACSWLLPFGIVAEGLAEGHALLAGGRSGTALPPGTITRLSSRVPLTGS